ncbi:MAG: dienelactone hydrolase family protein [Rickettsiales bacterium]|nr:dienelactone hydrolase family protein [Rickettsiales bacterium]
MLSFKTHYANKISKPKKLFIFIHGFYANGKDLLSLSPFFQANTQDTIFLAPDAPNINIHMPESFYWYNVGSLDPEYLANELKPILPKLSGYINELKKEYNLENKDITLYGFSQGALLILHYGLTQKEKFSGLIAHSGGLIPEILDKMELNESPVCLIHGDQDMVIPCKYSENSAKFLDSKNIKNQIHLLHNLDHSINQESINITNKFLK